MSSVAALLSSIESEARRAEFPVDREVYQKASRDPAVPILFAGSLDAPVCFFGRDLGKDEVALAQPLVGAGGRLIRAGVFEAIHGEAPPKSDRRLESILERVLLTNTVPFKPPGNKAYTDAVKDRFRPFVEELLAHHWTGSLVIPLGTEAFRWFEPYLSDSNAEALEQFWAREDRYERSLACDLRVKVGGRWVEKRIEVAPLPHPSPLNRRWLPQLPRLLQRRLDGKL